MSRSKPGRCIALLSAALLLLVLAPAPSSSYYPFPYDPFEDSSLFEVGSWRHPDGLGSDVKLNWSADGSMLVVVGYGAPDEVRVFDRAIDTLAVLETPEEGYHVKGARFSSTERWLAVWGTNTSTGNDSLLLFDVPSFNASEPLPWMEHLELVEISELLFTASDYILLIAGRAANGTSQLVVVETPNAQFRRVIDWQANASILHMRDLSFYIWILDDAGSLTQMISTDWYLGESFTGLVDGPTAWHAMAHQHWYCGSGEGRLTVGPDWPFEPWFNITVGSTPVQSVALTMGRPGDIIVAVEAPGGGSRLMAWQVYDELGNPNAEMLHAIELDATVTATSRVADREGRVLVGLSDGTLREYWLDIRPRPEFVDEGQPDQVDGLGLEPMMLWRERIWEGNEIFFRFNHRGSLIALTGTDRPNRLTVLDRSFEKVGEIDFKGTDWSSSGYAWSATDSWLVVPMFKPNETPNLWFFDVPSLERNTSVDISWTLEHVDSAMGVCFLDGDTVMVLSGTKDSEEVVCVFDFRNRTLIRSIEAPELAVYNRLQVLDDRLLAWDEERLNYSYVDLATYELIEAGTLDVAKPLAFEVNDAHAVVVPDHKTLGFRSARTLEPLGDAGVGYDLVKDVAWTGVGDGDLVMLLNRLGTMSTQLALWRDLPGSIGEPHVVSVLNTSLVLTGIEADPAYPGVIVASTDDGRFMLYHVNVTGYPARPEEIGGLPTNGTIDWTWPENETDTPDPSTGVEWGSWEFVAFPVAILVAIVALVLVYVRLRRGGDVGGSDGGSGDRE